MSRLFDCWSIALDFYLQKISFVKVSVINSLLYSKKEHNVLVSLCLYGIGVFELDAREARSEKFISARPCDKN